MNPRSSSERLLTRRLRALARTLPAAVEGSAGGVHKARVATRRIREALPVAFAEVPARKRRKATRAFRRITRALGPVRELDVALQLLTDLRPTHDRFGPALDQVRRDVEADRHARRERMLAVLEQLDLKRLLERVAAMTARGGGPGSPRTGHAAATVLAGRVARRVRSLRSAVDAAGALYAPEALHTARIAVKKVRYALELSAELKLLRSRRAIARLKAMQDVLGQLHDRQVLIERVRRVQATIPPRDRQIIDDLAGLADVLEEECRTLHASYIAQRQQLVAVADAALGALAAPVDGTTAAASATIH